MTKLKLIGFAIAWPLPWRLRRVVLQLLCGYRIARTAAISRWSLVLPVRLEMGEGSNIGPFTVCKSMSLLRLEEKARIGAFNWITAFPAGTGSRHFDLDTDRKPQLIVERHAAITSRRVYDLCRLPLADSHPQHRSEAVAAALQTGTHRRVLLRGHRVHFARRQLTA
jgi:hypothetical protein